jgi:hypothetical protein
MISIFYTGVPGLSNAALSQNSQMTEKRQRLIYLSLDVENAKRKKRKIE